MSKFNDHLHEEIKQLKEKIERLNATEVTVKAKAVFKKGKILPPDEDDFKYGAIAMQMDEKI